MSLHLFLGLHLWTRDFGINQCYQLDQLISLRLSLIMFSLNWVDYLMFSLLLSSWNELGHLSSKSYMVVGTHKILVTSPIACQ